MPVTLTLTNIPDDLYEHLTRLAVVNRRTVSDQAIALFDSVARGPRPPSGETLQRAQELRSELRDGQFPLTEIDAAKRVGRP